MKKHLWMMEWNAQSCRLCKSHTPIVRNGTNSRRKQAILWNTLKGSVNTMNIIKIASIAGTVLGIAGTLISSWAGQKSMDETIAQKVNEALANQANQ